MATLDDKLLGEKLHYYCSSSEEDEEEQTADGPPPVQQPSNQPNTGPKGVMEDWRRYKQLETEKRAENEAEKLALAKKLALTCRSEREDREAEEALEKLDLEEDDEFLKEYMRKRMQEMVEASVINRQCFGRIKSLDSADEFLDAVDHPEHGDVTTVVHIWEQGSPGCQAIDGCLEVICKEYSHVKFCRIQASAAGLSRHFKISGVPALLVYRGGDLMSTFVRITDTLGEDFYASDLESFLIENGVLSDAKLNPSIIRDAPQKKNDEDSD